MNVIIDGIEYAPVIKTTSGYSIIRCDRSGVFLGRVTKESGQRLEIEDCRRLYYWDGAATCSQLSIDGVSKPENCRFPEAEPFKIVLDAIEIIPASEKAVASLQGVSVWRA